MENVVTVIFNVESEAYQAYAQICRKPFGEGYKIAEAAQLKREGDEIKIIDVHDAAAVTANDTAMGMVIGSVVGILGGPLGVLLGAYAGGATGAAFDTADAIDSLSLLEVTAAKLYDGDVAIVALVQEDEPAFDAAFEGFDVTIIRHFAVDVMDEVDRAIEVEAEIANVAKQQLRAERKAELAAKRDDRKASVKEYFSTLQDQYDDNTAEREAERDARLDSFNARVEAIKAEARAKKAKHDAEKAVLDEAVADAEAEFVAQNKEYMGEK